MKMFFNDTKCNQMNITKNRNKIQHENSLQSKILERCPSTTNFWVYILKSDLTWVYVV